MNAFKKHQIWACAFIFPQMLVTVVFFIVPAIQAVHQSFMLSDPFGLTQKSAFLANYIDVYHDPTYKQAFLVTAIVSMAITVLTMGLGLCVAYLVAGCSRAQGMYKTLLIWPYAIAPAIAAILWRFLCQPEYGWLSNVFSYLGLNFNYLVNSKQALLTIVFAASWQQFSYNFIFFYAAIKGIPKSIIEASILDGTGAWRRLWVIVFPLISPTTFFLLTMNLIYSFFDTFGVIDVLTRGGPADSTTTLIYKVYQDGFEGLDFSSSAAQSVILMLIVSAIMILQFKVVQRKVHYQ